MHCDADGCERKFVPRGPVADFKLCRQRAELNGWGSATAEAGGEIVDLCPDHRRPAAEPDYAAEKRLPDGRTCADCFAVKYCVGIGCTTAESTSCDYWPNRFRLTAVAS